MSCPRHPDVALIPAEAYSGRLPVLACPSCDHAEPVQAGQRKLPGIDTGRKPRKLPGLGRNPRTDLELADPLPTGGSHLERFLLGQLSMMGAPEPVREFRFHPDRQWRADIAWPDRRLLVEVEGGVWMRGGGRHNRGEGYTADCRKYNAASVGGWILLRYTGDMIESGEAARDIVQVLVLRCPVTNATSNRTGQGAETPGTGAGRGGDRL
jgi:hypothetical protein